MNLSVRYLLGLIFGMRQFHLVSLTLLSLSINISIFRRRNVIPEYRHWKVRQKIVLLLYIYFPLQMYMYKKGVSWLLIETMIHMMFITTKTRKENIWYCVTVSIKKQIYTNLWLYNSIKRNKIILSFLRIEWTFI